MRISAVSLALWLTAVKVAAFTAPASNSLAFTRSNAAAVHKSGCTCAACLGRHPAGCSCPACTGSSLNRHCKKTGCSCPSCTGRAAFITGLMMSAEAEAEGEAAPAVEEAVPEEVASLEGIADGEEAHNADRPQRASGTAKHKDKKGGKPISDLEVGTSIAGTVKTITAYGAFINVGYSTDALLHISRMSDTFVSDVNDILTVGQEIEVRVMSVDTAKGQVAVTMRSEEKEAEFEEGRSNKRKTRPQRSGGDRAAQNKSMSAMAAAKFDDDKMIEGEVVSILDFGAFVRIDTSQVGEGLSGEVDGLVHISALSKERVDSVASVCNIGDKVQVRVKEVDGDAGKVSLSMISKADEPPPREKRQSRGGNDGKREWRDQLGDKGEANWKKVMTDMEQPEFKNSFVVTK
eukprot:CAMPEP_0194279804 /NCGR_PEP_ID=MMETSP0169-20130528/14130_1 /TAXON_ID=218684 /ORGANISM="Corethron pennatum, Strain L29A3" /LENGTH=404 /DNA_ID=CAMNT_0039024273 /DNA_START=133 /DNA_END=1347 /DNA_ORIENTATION=+